MHLMIIRLYHFISRRVWFFYLSIFLCLSINMKCGWAQVALRTAGCQRWPVLNDNLVAVVKVSQSSPAAWAQLIDFSVILKMIFTIHSVSCTRVITVSFSMSDVVINSGHKCND